MKNNFQKPFASGKWSRLSLHLACLLLLQIAVTGCGGDSSPAMVSEKLYFATNITNSESALGSLVALDQYTLSPETHEGKTAYRVHVYSSDGGKTKLIGYYERINDSAKPRVKAMVDKLKSQGQNSNTIRSLIAEDLDMKGGLEIRFPDSDKWLSADAVRTEIAKRLAKLGSPLEEINPK